MLWRVLQSNNGKLPEDAIVCFANTGKEEEATLEFVRDCGDKWNVPIAWIEYVWAEEPKDRFKVVDFKTASRNGEPFEELLNNKTILPNPVARFCSIELKIKTDKSLGQGHMFRLDRPSYKKMKEYAINQQDMFDKDEEGIACFCGD